MAETVTLWCELGEHHWERPRKRGRKPINCPEHQPVAIDQPAKISVVSRGDALAKAREVRVSRSDERVWEAIERILTTQTCNCDLRPGMKADDLRELGAGCTAPRYVCPVLDAYRRRLGV